jgi:acetoacetyl-CoA synthetase
LSGKLSELAVRAAIHGRDAGNLDALANPEALRHFHDRPELAS